MAPDPRVLRVKVQTDRLPDIGSKAQVSLRVSAVVDGADGALVEAATAEILPWRWHGADGTGDWNPHLPESWRFWRIVDEAGVPTIKDFDIHTIITAATAAPADFDLPDHAHDRRFHRRLQEEIDSIVSTGGLEASLCMPAETTEISGRTVFGLVESLTGLPHPVGVSLNVFTVFTIDTLPEEDTVFMAAPLFGPAGGGLYEQDASGPSSALDVNGEYFRIGLSAAAGPAPMFGTGSIDMRPSLSWKDLAPVDDPQRLIDMTAMLIKKPVGGHGLTDEDWAATLSRRIAEVVDPWARVLGALDTTVLTEISDVSTGNDLRECLIRDLSSPSPSKLLVALDSIAWWVAGKRSAASPVADPPSVSILEGIALRQPETRSSVAALILSAAERDNGSVANNPDRKWFASVARSRLKGLMGISMDPPGSIAEIEASSIESDENLKSFVAGFWLGGADLSPVQHPLASGSRRNIAAKRLTILPDLPAFGSAAAQPSSMPLLDLSSIAADVPVAPADPSRVAFDIALASPAGAFGLTVSFIGAAGRPRLPEIRISGSAASPALDVAIFQDGASVASTSVDRGAKIRIEMALFRPAPNASVATTLAVCGCQPVPADRLLSAPFSLALTADVADIPDVHVVLPDLTASPLRGLLDRIMTGPGIRADLALGVIGPYIPGITSGRITWDAPQPQTERDLVTKLSLEKRIVASVASIVGLEREDGTRPGASLYDAVLNGALADAGLIGPPSGSDEEKLAGLVKSIVEGARRNALHQAHGLVPSAADESGGGDDAGRRLTVDSPPLVFRFDQLQSITGPADLWTRLSGVGVLLSRTDKVDDKPAGWRSLNVATLHAPDAQSQSSPRGALEEANAVMVRNGGWAIGAIVDPVPMQVGEVGGVRAALLSYDNRSPVAEMATDAELDHVPSSFARRIEAYRFPPTSGHDAADYRLFALSFGYAFHVVPYVIGQGGTLPPILRDRPEDPLTIRSIETAGSLKGQVRIPGDTDGLRRSALYRRTRPIGAPRLAGDRPQGIPDGVVPLAGELAIRPPPVTIGGDVDGRFFLDREGRAGLLDVRSMPDVGLRIDIGRVEWLQTNESRELTVLLRGRSGASEDVKDLLSLICDLSSIGAVRIEAFGDMTTVSDGIAEPEWAEDEFDFGVGQDQQLPNPDIAQWRDISIVLKSKKEVNVEPPIVTPIVRQVDVSGNTVSAAVGKPRLAPECGHQLRSTYVLDGIKVGAATGVRRMTIRLQRPTVEFGTYSRWVNPPIFDDRLAAGRPILVKALDAALGVATTPNKKKEDRSLDDPAVTQLYAELVCIFPKFYRFAMQPVGASWDSLEEIIGFDGAGHRLVAQMPSIDIRVDTHGVEGLSGNTATVLPGHVYELHVYAGVPETQNKICLFTRDQRLSPAVKATLRRCPIEPNMSLAGPLVLTLEVATEAMPDIFGTEPLNIELRRRPEAEEQAWISLTEEYTRRQPSLPAIPSYPGLRYCHLAALESQRWSWRGRPQNDRWHRLATAGPDGIDQPLYDEQFESSFSDRRNDDIGEVFERRIERAHAFGGLRRQSDRTPNNPIPRLFEKSLDWRGGMNFWRFGLRIVNRYRSMRPGRPEFMKSSHRGANGAVAWQNKVVADRSSDRRPKRPGLAIVLPLTERAMAWGTTPPLLALFNEPLYPNFHIGDGIDAMVEMARHPMTRAERKKRVSDIDDLLGQAILPTGERLDRLVTERATLQKNIDANSDSATDALKYWPEHGPDPVRSASGSGGAIIPLRIDGPVGYTFDLATEAGRFDHAGLIITPVQPDVAPWSFVKLKFRRYEAPESIDPTTALTGQGPAPARLNRLYCAPRSLEVDGSPNRFRLTNTREIMRRYSPADFNELPGVASNGVFPAEHEGLVVDILGTEKLDGTSMRFQFTDDPDQNDFVRISFIVKDDGAKTKVIFQFATQLGDAGLWTLDLPSGGELQLRMIASAREKPEKGETYRPGGDVALRVRISRDATDEVLTPIENRWLSVACLPLTSSIEAPIEKPVAVVIKATGADATVSPVRLSTFTPATWWQFAEAMSLFAATIDGVGTESSTDDLAASVTGTVVSIALKPADQGKPGKLQSLAPIGEQAGQLEELLVLVLTRNIRDALDHVRERPVAVKLWEPASVSLDLAKADWPSVVDPSTLGDSGQVRFLRILRPKTRSMGGYLETAPVFPLEFFQYETIEGDADMNPPDASGMVLGMSMPIPWKRI